MRMTSPKTQSGRSNEQIVLVSRTPVRDARLHATVLSNQRIYSRPPRAREGPPPREPPLGTPRVTAQYLHTPEQHSACGSFVYSSFAQMTARILCVLYAFQPVSVAFGMELDLDTEQVPLVQSVEEAVLDEDVSLGDDEPDVSETVVETVGEGAPESEGVEVAHTVSDTDDAELPAQDMVDGVEDGVVDTASKTDETEDVRTPEDGGETGSSKVEDSSSTSGTEGVDGVLEEQEEIVEDQSVEGG
jgi:hypothetical protein